MNFESWGGHGIKVLFGIRSIGHLRYNKFNKNCKSSNFVNKSLDALFNNMEQNLSFDIIKLCQYLADNIED